MLEVSLTLRAQVGKDSWSERVSTQRKPSAHWAFLGGVRDRDPWLTRETERDREREREERQRETE